MEESESESLWIVCSLTLRRVNIGDSSLWGLAVFLEFAVEFEIIWGETIELSSGRKETVKDVRPCVSIEILSWNVEGCGKFRNKVWDGECMGERDWIFSFLSSDWKRIGPGGKFNSEFQNVKYPNP